MQTDHDYLSKVNEIMPAALEDWFLHVNVISCETDRVAEEWDLSPKNAYGYYFPFHVVSLAARQRATPIAFILMHLCIPCYCTTWVRAA